MGHFFHSIFVKEHQFYVRIEKYGKLWMLKITLLINMHNAREVFNSFQTLLNHIQGCVGCQMKGKTSIDMNLVVFCAKIQQKLKILQKCGKDTKICTFFEGFSHFF